MNISPEKWFGGVFWLKFPNTAKGRGNQLRWIGIFAACAAFAYLGYVVVTNPLGVQAILDNWRLLIWSFAASLGLYFFALAAQFVVWWRLISLYRQWDWNDLRIYSQTTFLRGLPGGAWHWLGRVAMYSGDEQVDRSVILRSNVLEWHIQLLIGASLFFFSWDKISTIARLAAAIGLLILAIYRALAWQPKRCPMIRRFSEGLLWVLLNLAAWLLSILIFRILISASGNVELEWLQATRVWSVASTVSLLFVMLPSGLGIREVAVTWLLQPYESLPKAACGALLLRLLYLIADLMWGWVGWSYSNYMVRRSRTNNTIGQTIGN